MKSLLLGLLITGTVPIASSAIATSELSSSLSSPLSSISKNLCYLSLSENNYNCQKSVFPTESSTNFQFNQGKFDLDKSLTSDSSLWLQSIAHLLLPGWTLEKCWHNSSIIQSQNSDCISPWQKLLDSKISRQTSLIFNSNLSEHLTTPQKLKSKKLTSKLSDFPQLSRGSLIVAPPTEKLLPCSSSTSNHNCPNNSQLANPAPATERIASPFGWRRRPYSGQMQFHQGIDYGAPLGSPVVATSNGIVTKVVSGCADFGNLWCGNQFGNWIEIDHGNGKIGIYGHLQNKSIKVKEGMKVWRNQEIARVGSSGWSTGAHLDFRLKVNGKYENPADHVMVMGKLKTEAKPNQPIIQDHKENVAGFDLP